MNNSCNDLFSLLILIAGSRLVAVIFAGVLTPQSLFPQFLVQIYATGMVLGNSSLCSTQLMMDPVTVKRVHALTMLSLRAFLPFAGVEPEELIAPGDECILMFNFLHIFFGVVLPMLAAAGQKSRGRRGKRGKLVVLWISITVAWAAALLLTILRRT